MPVYVAAVGFLFSMAAARRLAWPVSPAGQESSAAGQSRPDSPEPAVFTSTRSITCIAAAPDGTVWAGTTGGILRRRSDGAVVKFTRLSGLPSHETRALRVGSDGSVTAFFPAAAAVYREGRWRPVPNSAPGDPATPEPPPVPPPGLRPPARRSTAPIASLGRAPGELCEPVFWRGTRCAGVASGLRIGDDAFARIVPLPAEATGSHISVLLPAEDGSLLVAIFGDDRLWRFGDGGWRPDLPLPNDAREVTALGEQPAPRRPVDRTRGAALLVGTLRGGLWIREGDRWSRAAPPESEPAGHNIQSLRFFRGKWFAGTLEEGLVTGEPGDWSAVEPPVVSSRAPRDMAVFRGTLYLRHGDGAVDRFDGTKWERDVLAGKLPRGGVSTLASDGERLYAGQWGGWSEWDGERWNHRLRVPEVQGFPLTTIYPDDDVLWIGLQGRGLAEIDRASGRIRRMHDERRGLPDDWITAMARVGSTLYAGTFVGGLAALPDGAAAWKEVGALRGEAVTALEPDGAGGLYAGTRRGAWRIDSRGGVRLQEESPFLDTETQALRLAPDGRLWVGTRTGLYRLATKTDRASPRAKAGLAILPKR